MRSPVPCAAAPREGEQRLDFRRGERRHANVLRERVDQDCPWVSHRSFSCREGGDRIADRSDTVERERRCGNPARRSVRALMFAGGAQRLLARLVREEARWARSRLRFLLGSRPERRPLPTWRSSYELRHGTERERRGRPGPAHGLQHVRHVRGALPDRGDGRGRAGDLAAGQSARQGHRRQPVREGRRPAWRSSSTTSGRRRR